MRKSIPLLAGVSALAFASPASAMSPGVNTLCVVATGLNACAKATVTLTATGFTFLLENLTGAGYTSYDLTGIAFYHYGTPTPGTLVYSSQSPLWSDVNPPGINTAMGKWEAGVPNDLVNPGPFIEPDQWWGAQTGSSNDERMKPGATVTLTFASSFYRTGTNVPISWAWRGQSVVGVEGVNSLKCWESGRAEPAGALCGPPTVVPEPGSMVLLATGLVGLMGAGLVKRRKIN